MRLFRPRSARNAVVVCRMMCNYQGVHISIAGKHGFDLHEYLHAMGKKQARDALWASVPDSYEMLMNVLARHLHTSDTDCDGVNGLQKHLQQAVTDMEST